MALHQQQQQSQGHTETGPSEGHWEQEGSDLLSAVGACKEVVGRLEALLVEDSGDRGAARESCQGYREKCHALIMQLM